MIRVIKQIIASSILLQAFIVEAELYKFSPEKKLSFEISKSGLNRISNPPYKITQLTGDDSKFRIKYDEDGSNIYFMPLVKIGEIIEISIKNNVGHIQDLELKVANSKGRSIIIDAKSSNILGKAKKADVAQMLRAMQDNVESRFYTQISYQKQGNIQDLTVNQLKIYRYKELVGGVFEVTNPTKQAVILKTSDFAKRFNKVKIFYPEISVIEPTQTVTLLIIQEVEGK